ncbi:protein of unknown function [Candidatus Promineifilum breve]|uniref:Uncharacterized protein n=1 Tax=Candidatus Promineifilum breve TaxID=1806508 RepID=A0A160T1T1_9CHLR|nr:protein of unknown function [Candidatus Promineifilum breve]
MLVARIKEYRINERCLVEGHWGTIADTAYPTPFAQKTSTPLDNIDINELLATIPTPIPEVMAARCQFARHYT